MLNVIPPKQQPIPQEQQIIQQMRPTNVARPSQPRRIPFPDIDTKNVSFLQTAKDLRNQGIKNHMFFLALYDKDLKGVDPHSPFLTQDLMIKIINECMINPWYFLRECVRIPEQGGAGIPYQLHRGNLASTFCFVNGIDHYLVIPRQKGKTQSTIAILLWAFLFGTTNSEFMFANKSREDADNNLQRLKDQRDLLPLFMQFKSFEDLETGKQIKERDNVQSLANPVIQNKIVTKPSARSPMQAENIGRGSTQPIQYFDEVEFSMHIKTIIQAAGPAYNTASTNAKRNGAAYCRIFTSTPGDLDTQPGQDAMDIIRKSAKWTEEFYDWPKERIENYIRKNTGNPDADDDEPSNGIVYIEYQYYQLGDDENWLKKAAASVLNDPVKIKREIFLQRMRGSNQSPFEPETLVVLQEHMKDPIDSVVINRTFKLDIYTKLNRDQIYLVGMDVGHGLGADNTAVTVVDPYTLKPVAEFASPYIGLYDAQRFIHTLVKKYIPKAIICVERNNVGESILEYLRHQPDVMGRVYYDDSKNIVSDRLDSRLDEKGFVRHEAARRRTYGVYTQGGTRNLMFEILDAHMKDRIGDFVTRNITNDILALVRKTNTRIEAGSGFHDDSIMSYLIALYVYYNAKNLSRFGFQRGSLPATGETERNMTYEQIYDQMPEEVKKYFDNSGSLTQSDYNAKMIEEINQARREAQYLDNIIRTDVEVENLDDLSTYTGVIPGGFFDMLNE